MDADDKQLAEPEPVKRLRLAANSTAGAPDLRHFLELVWRGRQPGGSSGEQRTARLAMTVLEDLPWLDARAVRGLSQFIEAAAAAPDAARRIVGIPW